MITQEQIDAAWEVHGGGDAYEAFANGMRCGADLEREACADIVENANTPDCGGWTAQGIADAIRARGATDGKPT